MATRAAVSAVWRQNGEIKAGGAGTEDESRQEKISPDAHQQFIYWTLSPARQAKQFIDTITLYAIAILTTQMKMSFHKIYDAACLPLGRLSWERLKYKRGRGGDDTSFYHNQSECFFLLLLFFFSCQLASGAPQCAVAFEKTPVGASWKCLHLLPLCSSLPVETPAETFTLAWNVMFRN